MKHRALIAASLAAIAFASPVCFATELAVRAEGRRLYREGVQLERGGRRDVACERFERANAYVILDDNLWNIAMCHVTFGRRDLALAGFEIYLERSPEARASLEVQNLLWELEGQGPIVSGMEDWIRRMTAAVEAAESHRGATVPPEQQTYGAGTDSPGASARRQVVRDYGTRLFQDSYARYNVGDWEGALALWERSLTYRSLRNAAFNIGQRHLLNGRRDLCLHFYRLYVQSMPEVQADERVDAALQAIEDAPATIRAQAVRDQLADRFDDAVTRALGESSEEPSTASAGGQTPDANGSSR